MMSPLTIGSSILTSPINTSANKNIVAISGSLRAGSTNAAVLRAIGNWCPPEILFTLYEGLGDLPHFSPERDTDPAPPAVQMLRDLLSRADAVIICTPEYAHGMPGSLKNALDWLVGSGELVDKPVAALSASPSIDGGENARAWLVQTLTVMSANVVPAASFGIGLIKTKLDAQGNVSDLATNTALRGILTILFGISGH